MKVMGYSNLNIGSTSTVKWGNSRLRVALVLDNTGSMASAGKMDALKTATKNLLDQLKNAATTNGDVYVSIIPFSKDVNIGKSNVQPVIYSLGPVGRGQQWRRQHLLRLHLLLRHSLGGERDQLQQWRKLHRTSTGICYQGTCGTGTARHS